MVRNQKCIVSSSSPRHPNRVGYLQFEDRPGRAPRGVPAVILSDRPIDPEMTWTADGVTLFSVEEKDLEEVVDAHRNPIIGVPRVTLSRDDRVNVEPLRG